MSKQNNFAERLVSERKRLNLGQKDVVNATNVTQATLSRYENGERVPTIDFLADLSAVGFDALYILNGEKSEISEGGLTPQEADLVELFRESRDKIGLLKMIRAYNAQ